MAGHLAAYETRSCTSCSDPRPRCSVHVNVFSARRGRVVACFPSDNNGTTDIVLRPNGKVAWIERHDEEPPRPERHVHAGVSNRPIVTLDRGPEVVEGSLALADSTVYWTNGGQARSATLE